MHNRQGKHRRHNVRSKLCVDPDGTEQAGYNVLAHVATLNV